MKKKILSMCLVVALLAIAIVGGTMAYFTDSHTATNVITVGDVSAWLYESQYHRGATGNSYLKMTGQPDNLTDADIIADNETYHSQYLANATLMPFDLKADHRVQSMFEECTVAKNAYVRNTGDHDVFVRVTYLIPEDIAQYLDIFYVDTQFIAATNGVAVADARTLNNDDKTEPMITNVDSSGANAAAQIGDNKVTVDDKVYYAATFIYAERLESDEMTLYSPISKITMVPTVTNEIAKKITNDARQFDILVQADVIQADGFLNAVEAFDAFDIQVAG